MSKKRIAIGCDHAGYELKNELINKFSDYEFVDLGTNSLESVDYPDFAHPVAESVLSASVDLGILICGSGNGINMTANKHKGIRSALCWDVEIAELCRLHNDANILTLPARFITLDKAIAITESFLNTAFEGGRHLNRINKI